MKLTPYILWIGIILLVISGTLQAQDNNTFPPDYKVDTRIDNMGYWQKCAKLGLTPVQPYAPIPPARYSGSKVLLRGVSVIDSPDICVTNEPSNSTQSENSIVINPSNMDVLLNSNNSTPQPSNGTVKGADALKSLDGGETWAGTVEGAGGPNSGDPAAVIDLNGRWFVGYIDNASGQSVSYSDDNGATWTVKKVATGSAFNMLDKNHLWVDIGPTSPFKGNLYNGWMVSNNISVSRSITNGSTWSTPVNISSATSAGSHNQGVNFKSGPDGEVYAAWAVYDNWPGDEKAIGFSKSIDGGATWQPAVRALNNIKGIRTIGVSQNMRTNSFPVMAVDLSNSPYRGTIYIVWTNTGVPGINVGPGSSVYMIKSADKGATWSAPKRINSDSTSGKHHYLPWIACDQANGYLSIVFYDNRNCGAAEAEAWMAYSTDGGASFEDLKVSDVTFTPAPIPMMASKYMGDYLAIDAYGGKTFPCWTYTRSGHCLSYVSPIDILVPVSSITNTDHVLNDLTFGNGNGLMDYGETELIGLKMKNVGNAPADEVTVTLSCDNPYITMLDSIKDYGHFEPEEEKMIPDGYKFKVSDSIANNESVIFTVKAVDQKDSVTWSTFVIISHAPDVSILNMIIADPAPGGNNNGRLDPGESAIINIETKNFSIWDAEEVLSNLASMNAYVTVGTPTFTIGTLHAAETVIASFPVSVSSNAAIGSAARLHNVATSKYRVTDKYFNAKIGLIVEDWETGTFTKFPWEFTNPGKPWTIDPVRKYEGNYSSRSGIIENSESTGISINYHVSMDDSISFYKLVSTQPGRDNLKFYIDDAMIGMWSNYHDTLFRRIAYPVMAGAHTFKWVYEKDAAGTGGLDAVWTDFIVFPPQYKTTVSAGGDDEICAGSVYQLHGMADNYDSLQWSTTGTGLFSDAYILDPVYTPSSQDITTGSVILTLTAYGQNSIDTTNTMLLTISQPPSASAGGNHANCRGTAFEITTSTASNFTTLIWSAKGDGTFDQNGILHPVYTPGDQDMLLGSVKLLLHATGSISCPASADSMLLTIHALPQVDLGKDTVACANHAVTFDATTPGATAYLWLPSNQTTASINVDSTGTGLNTKKILVFVTDMNGCIGKDSVNVGYKVCGGIDELEGINLQIYPNPNNGIFTIEISSQKPDRMDITILSQKGETVFSMKDVAVNGVTTEKVNLDMLPQGTYLVQLSNPSGKIIRKIVIQK